ncbi:alpha-tectorin-like isoform X2 [Polypterus senegalus]|nr:alpha-tectorin-like isoform X2 [Polypterus senegalus]
MENDGNCTCLGGFMGDKCQDLIMKVICDTSFMKVMVIKEFFQHHNVSLNSLSLNNPSCLLYEEKQWHVHYYAAILTGTNYTSCGGTDPENNGTHVTFSNKVISRYDQIGEKIIRDYHLEVIFKCVYQLQQLVSLKFPIHPSVREAVLRVHHQEVLIVMEAFKDHKYKEMYSKSFSLKLRERVNIQVRMVNVDAFLMLTVLECWATQTMNYKGLNHTLILHGCPEDSTTKFDSKNGAHIYFRFSFAMFRFVPHPHELYLHCKVQLCLKDDTIDCIPNCDRSKRQSREIKAEAEGMLSYGPIRIEASEERSSLLLSAALPVIASVLVAGFLLVLIAIAKAAIKRESQLVANAKYFRSGS